MARRVSFLVDGFNLYHSVKDVHKLTGHNYRWLDIHALCDSFLSAIGGGAAIGHVYYFSAPAYHREQWKPGTVKRHQTYLDALEATGVIKQLGVFKSKLIDYRCDDCGYRGQLLRHEEKETDVAIASKMIELAVGTSTDVIVLLSGDTDLIPAIRTSRALSHKPVYVLFPLRRSNAAFDQVVSGRFKLTADHYSRHQLPDPVVSAAGSISKPASWV